MPPPALRRVSICSLRTSSTAAIERVVTAYAVVITGPGPTVRHEGSSGSWWSYNRGRGAGHAGARHESGFGSASPPTQELPPWSAAPAHRARRGRRKASSADGKYPSSTCRNRWVCRVRSQIIVLCARATTSRAPRRPAHDLEHDRDPLPRARNHRTAGRTAALRQLVLQTTPPVVARMLGYSDDHTARLVAEVGGTWARCAPGDVPGDSDRGIRDSRLRELTSFSSIDGQSCSPASGSVCRRCSVARSASGGSC